MGILGLHDGSPQSPHALLSSGNHSSGYFDTPPLFAHERLLRQAASDLLNLYFAAGGNIEVIDRVVGPKTGGAKMAEALAKEISFRRERPCKWGVLTKYVLGDTKLMVFDDEELEVTPGEVVLVCDDVFTTGGSISPTIDAVERARGKAFFLVCVLVNCSGSRHFKNHELVALINRQMPIWAPEECPLCREGSEAKRLRGSIC